MGDGRDIVGVYPVKEKPGGRASMGVGILAVLGFLGLIGLFIWFVGHGRVHGTVTLNVPGQSWTMHVNHCASGARRGFYGVSFFDHSQPETGGRLAMPEDGEAHLSLNVPSASYAVRYTKSDCTVWDVDMDQTNSTYNNVRGMEGHARFDCSTKGEPETHAVGDVTFDSCH